MKQEETKNILKIFLKLIIPKSLFNFISTLRDNFILYIKHPNSYIFKTNNLMNNSRANINNIFSDMNLNDYWDRKSKIIFELKVPDLTGGVNQGDRRAIFYLIKAFKPINVLEIGTFIGASTIHIASALSDIKKSHLISVDIIDVNSDRHNFWLKHNSKLSPYKMIKVLGFDKFVDFITQSSIKYFKNVDKKFDFIFLDGDHSASMVYHEIHLALNALSKDGIILLHDYFPNNKPIWSNGKVIPGPYLAVKRILKENADIMVIPLAELPWETKDKSKKTSLALLARKY